MLISLAVLLMNCIHVGIILLLGALVSSGGLSPVNESGLSQTAVESAMECAMARVVSSPQHC